MSATFVPSAEFYFTRDRVNFTVFPNSYIENGNDMFDVINSDTDEFIASFPVAPTEDVDEAFNFWYKNTFIAV